MTYPKTINGCCSKCGSADMLHAEDRTTYTPCVFGADGWEEGAANTETSSADDAIRFFCTECGEYHEVPEELG